ncbi:MAG: hypothetical protein JWM95_2854 [Gemmatimonadetes bacterium]|nr:hypothetical protein [Gemmatimonadota bacterium]
MRVDCPVTVVAYDPEMCVIPPPAALRIRTKLSRCAVDDRQCLTHERAIMATRMRGLVHTRERGKHVVGPFITNASRNDSGDFSVHVEPGIHPSPKMRQGGTRRRANRQCSNTVRGRQASCHHTQRSNTPGRKFENGRCVISDVVVHVAELVPDIAARMIWPATYRA